jgi:hypothetical protein
MKHWLLVAAMVALGGGELRAQDSLQKIEKELNLVLARGAKAGPDSKAVAELVDRALDLATDHQDDDEGFAAYSFVLDWAGELGKERHAELYAEVLESLIDHHLDDDAMASIVLSHVGIEFHVPYLAKPAADYFTWIERDSKSPAVKAACAWTRARHAAAAVATLADAKAQIAKLEALKKEIGERSAYYGRTYAALIDEVIEGLKIIGTPAREIAAQDLDGVDFKLSDYRGKVVLLDFWGYW